MNDEPMELPIMYEKQIKTKAKNYNSRLRFDFLNSNSNQKKFLNHKITIII
jgi:hypothetical protein